MESYRIIINIWLSININMLRYDFVLCSDKIADTCIFIDYLEKYIDFTTLPCSQSSYCNKTFKISYIDKQPFTLKDFNDLREIERILHICCGTCVNFDIIKIFKNISELTLESIGTSDFIYPILASATTTTLYGFYFLPYTDMTEVVYITKSEEYVNLIEKILDLYPIYTVAIFFAIISGFIAWIIETWSNKGEFQRPFFMGWFDGFWWSFVSMTTVGYGDKSPRTILARLFAVVWILIGLIVCSIFTGVITGQIVKANSPQPPSISGAHVGVLRYRDYDAFVVLQHGGDVTRNDEDLDLKDDVIMLTKRLWEEEIDGFILDTETLWLVCNILETEAGETDDLEVIKLINFFLQDTKLAEKTFVGEKFTYGILVRHEEDYKFFKDSVKVARHRNVIYSSKNFHNFKMNKKDWKLFSPTSKYFFNCMITVAILIGLIVMFGTCFELHRKRFVCKLCTQQVHSS